MADFSKIARLAFKAKCVAEQSLEYIREDITYIIENQNISERKIESVLDRLLDCAMLGVGEEEFIRLNNYYRSINSRNARSYDQFYREMMEEELDESELH